METKRRATAKKFVREFAFSLESGTKVCDLLMLLKGKKILVENAEIIHDRVQDELRVEHLRFETNAEYAKRLAETARKREASKKAAETAKARKEAKDAKELKRLAKKYHISLLGVDLPK